MRSKILIAFVGPPGSGKGTQARLLAEKLHLPIVVTGDLIRLLIGAKPEVEQLTPETVRRWFEDVRRELLARGAPEGKLTFDDVLRIYESGGLIPDAIVVGIIKKRLSMPDCARGAIVDGFPRTVEQAKFFEQLAKEIGASYVVIELVVPKKECRWRILGKRAREMQRCDDTAQAFEKRWHEWEEKTKPMVEYLRERGCVLSVGGVGPIEQIHERILTLLKEVGVT